MVKNFTANDWNQEIHLDDGAIQTGIVIPQNEHQVIDPIVQVFEKFGDDQFQAILDTNKVFIGVSSTQIILLARQPFDGKVVIK